MSKADIIFKTMCQDIIDNGFSSKGQIVRPHWEDGVPAHTIKKFGVVNRYNLAEEFPALTLRPTAIKSATEEMLWIYQKHSNNVNDLSTRIWDSWGVPSTKREIISVSPRKHKKYKELPKIQISEIKEHSPDEVKHSKKYGDYIIIGKDKLKRTIQFLNTGSITVVNQSTSSTGEVKDCYQRTVANVGYYGNYKAQDIVDYFGKYLNKWITTWENMIRRGNGIYSGGGDWYDDIFVDIDFHCCETFLRWVMKNNPYKEKEKLEVLQIDKDYYGSNCYSPDTCTLLTPEQNSRLNCKEWYEYKGKYYFGKQDLANEIKRFYNSALKPNGRYNDYAMEKFIALAEENGELKRILLIDKDGNLNRFPLEPEYTILRAYGYQMAQKYKFPEGEMTQIDDVIWQIKNTPYSRRILTNMYNFQDLSEMALAPCAYSVTFNVVDGVLNAILNQRSQDTLAANNWNVVQYSILLMMLAQVCDLKVGELVHVIADAHIYDRHVPIIKELISRESFPAPKVHLNPNIHNFYDFTKNDVIVEEYKHNPQIKGIPVAI